MQCEQAQAALALARDADGAAELGAHLAGCESCRVHARAHAALDRALAEAEPLQPSPDFDARFFARLEVERSRARARSRVLRLSWLMLPAAAAAAALTFHLGTPPCALPPAPAALAELPADELAMAMDLEMVEDLEVVQKLDEVEAYEVLGQLDDAELDAILAEAP